MDETRERLRAILADSIPLTPYAMPTVLDKILTLLPQWISVEERLPDEELSVLIILNGEIRIGCLIREDPAYEETFKSFTFWDDPNDDGQGWEWHDITHWQPLPPREG